MPGPYILLVEDNPGDARLTQLLLTDPPDPGLPPLRWAQTAEDAITTLGNDADCTAVLLDLDLPDSEGLEGLHRLMRYNWQVPVIVMTGQDSAPMGLDAVVSGAQDFLVKGSFDAAILRRCIAFSRQRKRAEMALLDRALHDELTQLPRRELLLDRLQAALRRSTREGTHGGLLFIDLDRFKQINDRHGHAAGDAVLKAVADRLRRALRASDTVARIGGDEFVVLLNPVAGQHEAVMLADKLLAAVEQPIDFEGQRLAVGASVGVCHFADGSEPAADLLARADAAMYEAKNGGRGRVCVLQRPDR